MTTGETESSLKTRAIEHFLTLGYRHCFEELPFLTRKIDLCFYDPKEDRILSVELKVKNWQDALRQARVYQLCSDEVYVVLHPSFAHRADLALFKQFGIGLLAFGDASDTYLPASASPVRKHRFHAKILSLLKNKILNKKELLQ
jgi:hypothetical protein